MEEREGNKVNVPRFILAFTISLFVLAFAFTAGYVVSFFNYQKVSQVQNTLKIDLLSIQLEREFLNNCSNEAFYFFSNKLDETGSLISILETRLGKNDENVLEKKKEYSLIEVQHFLSIKKYSQDCSKNIDTILFFYSNNEGDDANEADRIGKILGKIKDERKDSIMIYSFDSNLDLEVIRLMKNLYGVSDPNIVVVNEKILLKKIDNIDNILSVI